MGGVEGIEDIRYFAAVTTWQAAVRRLLDDGERERIVSRGAK